MAVNNQLSSYAERLQGEAKTRFLDKPNGLDLFLLASSRARSDDSASFPPVETADIISYLVLETSFVTAQQFKAHSPWKPISNLLVARLRTSLHGQLIRSQL